MDGRMYSRALQAYTTHYYRLRCGTQVWTSQFRTENLALGNTAPEPYPVDRDRPGDYAWPNMDFGAGPNEKHVDPQTGILINRLTGPKSYLHGDYIGVPALGVFDRSGGKNPWQFQSGTQGATYTANGSTPAKLYVPLDASKLTQAFPPTANAEIVQLDWVTLKITGSAGSGGDDGRLVACLTTDGVACAGDSLTAEVDLQSCGSGCTLGDTRSGLAAWSPEPVPPFAGPDLGIRKTVAAYNRGTGALTWSSGYLFTQNTVAGSTVWIGNVPYKVRTVDGPKVITIDPGLNLSAQVTVAASTFGALLWKKTGASGTSVRLTELKFNLGAPYAFTFWNQSSANHCHPELVQYQGQDGYHCVLPGASGSLLAWINRATGDAHLLGALTVLSKPDASGNGLKTAVVAAPAALFDSDDPNVMYGVAPDQNGAQVVVRMTYGGDNSPKNGGVGFYDAVWSEVRNLTPAKPGGYDLESLIKRFDSRYDPARFSCGGHHMQEGKLVVVCSSGQDYTPGGWLVVFDPKITPGAAANPVVAAVATFGPRPARTTPLRWCVYHSTSSGDPGWLMVGANPAASGPLFTTTLAQPAGLSDANLSVTGEPGAGAIDIARVGDYFVIDKEIVKITGKSGAGQWTVARGQAGSSAAVHTAGAAALARCAVSIAGADGAWWNWAADPHGVNASGKTVDTDTPYFAGGHGVFAQGMFTRVIQGPDCTQNAGGPVCLANRIGALDTSIHKPATSHVNLAPGFAGVVFGSYAYDSHPSRAQMAASDFEKQWVLDSHPLLYGTVLSAPVSPVSGAKQLYVMTRTLRGKQVPAYAACGSHPLLDVSGPGSVLGDGAGHAYRYCVPNAPGECRSGSTVGEVYLNCPNLTYLGCKQGQYESSGQNTEDVCIFDGSLIAGAQVLQRSTAASDRTGAYTRRITHGFARYRRQEEGYTSNGKALPGGEWALFMGRWIDGQRSDIYAAKLPPFQAPDGINRNTFVRLDVTVSPAPAGTADAVVEFGYGPDYRCASRREACVAVSPAVDEAAPFYWASESFKGAACSGGCTIAIPAVSQRMVYYRVKYRKKDGTATIGKSGVLASR